MPISPLMAGYLANPLTPTIVDDRGNVPVGLASATLQLLIYNQESLQTSIGAGEWVYSNNAWSYIWDESDLATAGLYTLTIIVTIGGRPVPYGPLPWEVKPAGKL